MQIDTIAVATRDRPRSARASIASHLRNAREHGRRVRVVVADDSRGGTSIEEALADLRAEYGMPIEILDRSARACLAEEAGGSDLIREALLGEDGEGFAVGAVRNSLLVRLAGHPFVSFDDDTVVPPARMPGAGTDLRRHRGPDPTVFHFFRDRAAALSAVGFDPVDVVGVHESMLGASFQATRVALTQLGVVGDSGMGSTFYYLLQDGVSAERLLHDYPALRLTREVVRGVESPTLCGSSCFMTLHAGLDNRMALPPFLPTGRGSESPFVLALRRSTPDCTIGHLPWVVRHEPPAPRRSEIEAVVEAAGSFQTSALVALCVAASPPGDNPGRFLSALGSGPPRQLSDFLEHQARRQQLDRIARLERNLAASPEWADDLRRCLDVARHALNEVVIHDDRAPGAWPRLQRKIERYGDLLQIWLEIRATRG